MEDRPGDRDGPDTSTTDLELGRPRALTVRQDQDVLDDTRRLAASWSSRRRPQRRAEHVTDLARHVVTLRPSDPAQRVAGGPTTGRHLLDRQRDPGPGHGRSRTRGKIATK